MNQVVIKFIYSVFAFVACIFLFLFIYSGITTDPPVRFLNSSDDEIVLRVIQGEGIVSHTRKMKPEASFYYSPNSDFGFSVTASNLNAEKDICSQAITEEPANGRQDSEVAISCCMSTNKSCDMLEYELSYLGMKVEYTANGILEVKSDWWAVNNK